MKGRWQRWLGTGWLPALLDGRRCFPPDIAGFELLLRCRRPFGGAPTAFDLLCPLCEHGHITASYLSGPSLPLVLMATQEVGLPCPMS